MRREGEAAETRLPYETRVLGFLGIGTPSTRCTFDEGKETANACEGQVCKERFKRTRMAAQPLVEEAKDGKRKEEISSGSRAETTGKGEERLKGE